MKKIFLSILLIQFYLYLCIIPDISDLINVEYELNAKNENGGNVIELKSGINTKVLFQLTPKKNIILNNDYFMFINQTSYKLLINDEKINLLENEIILSPNKKFVYSTYIGLKCDDYNVDEFTLKLKVTHLNDSTENIPIEYGDINIKINQAKNQIDLNILLDSIPGKSLNYFKIKNEIYNIDDISFEISKIDNFKFNEIYIKPFTQREEISEQNSENHGIFFDFPFGTEKTLKELGKDYFEFSINIKNNKCFELKNSKFNFKINEDLPITINENTKTTFKYNLEDQTSQYNITNSLKLKTVISATPIILTCEFKTNSVINETFSDNNKIYRNVINKNGFYNIIINNLDNFQEYNANCEISNTNYVEKEKINVTIGNYIEADIFHNLIPSRDENALPQCANFTFEDENSFGIFIYFSENYCKYIMKMDELLSLHSFQTIICEPVFDLNEISTKFGKICVAPTSFYNNGHFLEEKNKNNFEKKFNEFIEKIQNIEIITYGKLIKVKSYIKYYDTDINPSSIIATISKEESSIIGTKKFVFNVLSTNINPIQCYYNLNLDENSKIFQLETSVLLNPNQKKKIEVGLITILSENKMYSLEFKCYNLPGFKYRYKTTGSMVMYTYLNTEGINQLINIIPDALTVNCNEKENQQNPRCLIDKAIPLMQNLQTDIPSFIKEIFNNGQLFSGIVLDAQNQILKLLVNDYMDNFKNLNFNNLVENATTIFDYIAKMECYIYSSGSSKKESDTIKNKDYEKCRKEKQNYFENIVNSVKPVLECSPLIKNITEGLDKDIDLEEKFKYILFLIHEMSNNPDSYKKDLSQILFDATFCLQDNFDNLWEKIDLYLKDIKQYLNYTVESVKKDALISIFHTLSNFAKIIHFEEIDKFIDGIKTKTGLFISNITETIYNKMIEFSKKFNDLGEALYTFSDSTILKVEKNKGLDNKYDSEINILNIPEKNILIKYFSNYMLRYNNASTLQVISYESPLVSVKSNGKKR